jgi:hypothetical protein
VVVVVAEEKFRQKYGGCIGGLFFSYKFVPLLLNEWC